MVVIDVVLFCFWWKKLTSQGLYNCKLKNEFEFVFAKKKKKKKNNNNNNNNQAGKTGSRISCTVFNLTKFSLPG